jgi:outer membrane usher protein
MQCREADGAKFSNVFGWRIRRVLAGFACCVFLFGPGVAGAASAEAVEYAKAISNRLNTTGKAIDLEVPLKDQDRALGDIAIRINPDDSVLVNKPALTQILASILDAPSRQRLETLAGSGPFLALRSLKSAGFDIRFDPALQELTFYAAVEQRASEDISFAGLHRTPVSAAPATPARVSGYVNMFASLDQQWATHTAVEDFDTDTSGRLELDSAVRMGNVVVENRGVVTGSLDFNVCPTTALCDYAHTPGFKRQTSRLVYDMPADRVRMELGDVEPLGTSFQGTPDMLGLSFEKSARKLSPNDTFAPTGAGSFRVDRPSQVDVVINGVVQQQMQLRPGTYNIRDLPLATGANDVEILITDDTGSRRTVTFTSFFDTSLLATGKSEWGITGGVPSYFRDEERQYLSGLYMGSGFLRYGLTDTVTADVDLQSDNYFAMAGVGLVTQSRWGLIGLRAAGSLGDTGAGLAASLDWSAVNFQGLTGHRGETARLFAEYRSPDFHTPGEISTEASGIIYPQWNYWLDLNATYSAPVGDQTTAALSARYQFVTNEQLGNAIYAHGDRYGADVTLSRPLTPWISGSLTLGYSNESYLAELDPLATADPELRVALRFFVRPDDHTSITAGFDSLDRQSDVSAYRSEGNGVGRWDTSINVQQNDFNDHATVSGTAGYYGNRGQVRVMQNSGLDGVSYGKFNVSPGPQRTSVQIGTAVAFADGHVAVGAPVTGDAFAIVYPHESIADKTITVGSDDNVRAVANAWGPALVTAIPAYSPSTISVDADELPIGYSLGAGAFDTVAPFKAGYDLEVGSAYSVSAYGTLLLADGQPVSLLTGVARSMEHPDRTVTLFTNASGRFGAEGLSPGRWILEMATDAEPTKFVLDVPARTDGLFKAGTLHPAAAL